MKQRYAGIDSEGFLKSMSTTFIAIRNPTNIKAGATANPGIAIKIGPITNDTRNKSPVTHVERPVLPPSFIPAELST